MTHRRRRRVLRLPDFDYTQDGAYFITMVTQGRRCLLGRIEDSEMHLSEAGSLIENAWIQLPERFPSLAIDQFVVMPNHLHGILTIGEGTDPVGAPLVGARPAREDEERAHPVLGDIVGALKSLTTVEYIRNVKEAQWPPFEGKLWQRNYYEHIIRDSDALERIREYIMANPANWALDPENPNPAGQPGAGQPQGLPLRGRWMV